MWDKGSPDDFEGHFVDINKALFLKTMKLGVLIGIFIITGKWINSKKTITKTVSLYTLENTVMDLPLQTFSVQESLLTVEIFTSKDSIDIDKNTSSTTTVQQHQYLIL